MRLTLHPPLHAMLALGVGFALMSLVAVERAFEGIALALTVAGHGFLDVIGFDVVRRGAELRDPLSGAAVVITNVCDGHGILIGWAGVLFVFARGWRSWMTGLAAGFAAILLFNLLRVVTLYLIAVFSAGAFEFVHYYAFPLLTALLVMGFGAIMFEPVRRRAARALALTVAFAIPWWFVAEDVGAALTPLANALLSLFAPEEVTTIAERAAGWTVGTRLIESAEPLTLRLAAFEPSDFVLAAPALLGAAVAARGEWRLVAAAVAAMVAAMALGAVTAVWGVAIATDSASVALPAGAGLVQAAPYAPPPAAASVVALVQNVLVHLNLLVLPTLILGLAANGRDD